MHCDANFHVLHASAIPLFDHFVLEQQQAVRRKGDFCLLDENDFFLVKNLFQSIHNHNERAKTDRKKS